MKKVMLAGWASAPPRGSAIAEARIASRNALIAVLHGLTSRAGKPLAPDGCDNTGKDRKIPITAASTVSGSRPLDKATKPAPIGIATVAAHPFRRPDGHPSR